LSIREDLDFKVKRGEKYDPQDHAKVLEEIDCLTEESTSLSQAIETANIEEKLDRDIGNLNECRNLLNFNAENVPQLEQELILLNKVKVYHKQYSVYSRFQSDLKKYKNVKSSLKELHIMKNKVEVNHATTVLFKHKVVESENDSLNFVVSLINTHLSMFLTDFFSEESDYHPIYVRLELVLDNNKRPQVNTVINYKGSIVDQKSLSTGEYARVKLAFDLTFKEILGESIVMLDECTANLDEDLSTKIFYDIKKSFPHRTILAVSHQATSGCFENFVTL
jgi:DNA repair ATPase RecN